MTEIQTSDGFKIVASYTGRPTDILYSRLLIEDDNTFGKDIFLPKDEKYTYKYYLERHMDGTRSCGKIVDGAYDDLEALYSEDILERDFPEYSWCSAPFYLIINHDKEKHPELSEQLRNVVRKHLSGNELDEAERDWNSYDESHEPGDAYCLLEFCFLNPVNLRSLQNLLDDINAVIEPIKDECDCGVDDGDLYIMEHPFGAGEIKWTDAGFKVVGTEM